MKKTIVMKKTMVSGIFVTMLLLLVAVGYVSNSPRVDEGMQNAQGENEYVHEAHLGHYREHLERLGLEPSNCR